MKFCSVLAIIFLASISISAQGYIPPASSSGAGTPTGNVCVVVKNTSPKARCLEVTNCTDSTLCGAQTGMSCLRCSDCRSYSNGTSISQTAYDQLQAKALDGKETLAFLCTSKILGSFYVLLLVLSHLLIVF